MPNLLGFYLGTERFLMHHLQNEWLTAYLKSEPSLHMGLVATKPVFGVSDKALLKPVSLAAETKLEYWNFAYSKFRYDPFQKWMRSWSAPVLFTNHESKVFSRRGPHIEGIAHSYMNLTAQKPFFNVSDHVSNQPTNTQTRYQLYRLSVKMHVVSFVTVLSRGIWKTLLFTCNEIRFSRMRPL